jgi:glucose/arabinose dehydrogenase
LAIVLRWRASEMAMKYEKPVRMVANGRPWGRPVDVQVMPDGALLVSDDFANVIYRISYSK